MTDKADRGAVPSTPSWMNGDQGRRRNKTRGYGRRFSGLNSGVRSTATKTRSRRDSALFGTIAVEDGEGASVLDRSANARLEGRRRLPLAINTGEDVLSTPISAHNALDQSAHARLESRSKNNNGLDLKDEFEQISKPKKKRPNLPRPPRAAPPRAARRLAAKKTSSAADFITPKATESNAFVFEPEAESSTNDIASSAIDGAKDDPTSLLESNSKNNTGEGDIKRSKITYRRANSTTAASSSRFFEENVHPNDAAASDATNSSPGLGTRRSTRLQKKKMTRRASVANKPDNETAAFVTTRSRAKANSKKRSANNSELSGSEPEQSQQRSPPNLRTASGSSFSTESFSSVRNSVNGAGFVEPSQSEQQQQQQRSPHNLRSASGSSVSSGSFSATRNSANGSGRSESFSSLARQCSDKSWASGKGAADKKSAMHKRSVSSVSSTSNNSSGVNSSVAALKTPSSNGATHNRSTSFGGDLSFDANNMAFIGTPSFLSPEGGGISTPSVGSASSRKRSCVDFASSPSRRSCVDFASSPSFDELGGSERVSRPRKGPPPRFMMKQAINEIESTLDNLGGSERVPRMRKTHPPSFTLGDTINEMIEPKLKRITSEPAVRGPAAMSILSPPPKSSFGNALTGEMSFLEIADDNKGEARDRLSSNDDSMMSTESGDDDSASHLSEDDDDEGVEENGTPSKMTDAQVFESKPSLDDLRFLARSLQKWSNQGSHGGGGRGHRQASMGLNNGCLVAVPPGWTFERRAKFAQWVSRAFGFRVGSVGGAGCGTFLRCGDAEGRDALARLRQILNDHKAGRLVTTSTGGGGGNGVAAAGKKRAEKSPHRREKPKAKLPIKLSSQRSISLSRKGPPTLSMSPFCDDFVGDLLADGMKEVTLGEKKSLKSNTPVTPNEKKMFKNNTPCKNNVPHFIRSMTLQPLANKMKKTTLPCFRDNSPSVKSSGGERPPRLSAESAIHGSDLLDQLHGVPGGSSPSPPRSRFRMRFRDRVGRALQPAAASRPSLEKSSRISFERPAVGQLSYQGCPKSFQSPHPRNSLAMETPSCLETPMPKEVKHWGSRPVMGKDWGESMCCSDSAIDQCNKVFAKSWFTSEFRDNEDLCAQYQMALDDADDSEVASINSESQDEFPIELTSKQIGFVRCTSVGASAFNLLNLDDKVNDVSFQNDISFQNSVSFQNDVSFQLSPIHSRRRTMKLRKYARMSLCVAAASDFLQQPKLKRCYRQSEPPMTKSPSSKGTPINSIEESTAFSSVLSFLNEGELIHSASLVCTNWADSAAEALGNLMLVSVGCDPSLTGNSTNDDCSSYDEADETDSLDEQAAASRACSSVAKSMERDWPYLMKRFPWAKFLSDGSFKRVYKVWNAHCGAYEALSVMDVDAIDDLGNSDLVGTELAVSVLLSSVARRNICPNFVITRGVFTCQHEPPAPFWGSRDEAAPSGTSYDEQNAQTSHVPKPDQFGNYQYIRMELCQHGDMEEFIKNHPERNLVTGDCRNLLFQMAFALHVISDRFGLKHYDVKLLNFFLQSAKDPTIADGEHPHVVLRYGVGSHVFRLRMHPSSAHIAKLADYGTSVMRTDSDGQPVSLSNFTTLENTPPDFLILGNAAEQGYGHDCFGLGLCMLHLFTGHGPYEEILEEVVCPENLKGQLRKIWKQRSHNVIRSVMYDNDENGAEIEDETLYHTLYRFLVLFGIPEKQFDAKNHGKVWRAINSTLLPPKRARFKKCPDIYEFEKDRKKFSLANGTDKRIADARRRLLEMDGAMELLLSLVSFDPKTRATPLDVINSRLMQDLIEDESTLYCEEDMVKSYTAYLAN